jgi:fructan beta-fructosidase
MKFWILVPAVILILTHRAVAADITVQKRYLHVPVARDGETNMVHLSVDGQLIHYFRIALPKEKSNPLYWASVDVNAFRGKKVVARVQGSRSDTDLSPLLEQSDFVRHPANLYNEEFRPQYHFTPRTGWMNDPNGLVFSGGEFHLFYQHNPYGTGSANKSWGHASSRDLVHWKDYGDVLLPDRLGTIYSGSAVLDARNSSGFGKGSRAPLVALYTSAGGHAPEQLPYTQSLAFSNDNGRSWNRYESNPVIGHIEGTNRDPKVSWHHPTSQWVMALYLSRSRFALFGSPDLKHWTKLSDVNFPDGHECPELFELPVDGNAGNTRWVIWEGAGRHMIGRFDGKTFTAETDVLSSEWGKHCYAGQT